MNRFCSILAFAGTIALPLATPAQSTALEDLSSHFKKVVLESNPTKDPNGVKDPMELAVAPDGRVFYAQRDGTVKILKPGVEKAIVAGKLEVFKELEDGLLGITLDPNFQKNGWVYLYYGYPPTTLDANGQKEGENRVSRFTVKGDTLDLASEKVLLKVKTQRQECCHSGGSLNFDAHGNLYASLGDNTNPFHDKTQPANRNGYAPIDERPLRGPWDAQKSAANPNDLRGKILRIHPESDGTYSIPKGNLFPPGTAGTRPEIYVMGCRNPFRIAIDKKTGFLYWGEVGPDAGSPNSNFGPAGFDEINQARKAGNFGWPYFVADNKAYYEFDYETSKKGELYNPEKPINNSPNNTGIKELPPAQPAFIWYPSSPSTRFPMLASGGRTAMAGPVYYFDPKLKSKTKLPKAFDHTLFIYEWSRNFIKTVNLTEDDKLAMRHIEPSGAGQVAQDIPEIHDFLPKMTFKRPMDMELGPDGCLYIIEWGTNWGDNNDTQIIRLEYHDGE